MKVIDGGYLTWVYGSQVWGFNSWNTARLNYVDDIWCMDSPNLIREQEFPTYKEHRREKAAEDPEMAERKERVREFRDVIYSDPSIRTLEIPGAVTPEVDKIKSPLLCFMAYNRMYSSWPGIAGIFYLFRVKCTQERTVRCQC